MFWLEAFTRIKADRMALKAALLGTAFGVLAAYPASAAPMTSLQSGEVGAKRLVEPAGYSGRRSYRRDCAPYNGPFGYYGNPWCEDGFSRYGEAGGYEIDLTPYLDGTHRRWDRRHYRRHRY